jgi:glycosyltransferase involved in cell wall biosynthesis
MSGKIGFVLKGYPRISETFIAQEMQLLEERGFDIEIYALRGAREVLRQPVHSKIKAKIFYPPEMSACLYFVAWLGFFKALLANPRSVYRAIIHALTRNTLKGKRKAFSQLFRASWLYWKRNIGPEGEISHLHSHFVHSPTEMTFYLSLISGATYSISAHAKDIYTSNANEIYERVSSAKFLMTCTNYNWKKIREIVGPQQEAKVFEVYHGVNLKSFERKTIFPDVPNPLLLTVARIVEKKGYPDVLRALKILEQQNIMLNYEIYGDGEDREVVEKFIESLNLKDRVKVFGTVAQPEVLKAYERAGVFVLGSKETDSGDRDGIPNSMAEAMSMELPVVATNVSGIPELLENGKNGLMVNPGRPEEIAEAIKRILQEPGLGKKLGEEARRKVTTVFDCDRCVDRCEQLLKPFVQRK